MASLVALLCKVASSKISADLQQSLLKHFIKILKKADKLSSDLPLLSQLLVCNTHYFEVFHEGKEMIMHLPDQIQILQNLWDLHRLSTSSDKFFNASFGTSILKSTHSLFTFNM